MEADEPAGLGWRLGNLMRGILLIAWAAPPILAGDGSFSWWWFCSAAMVKEDLRESDADLKQMATVRANVVQLVLYLEEGLICQMWRPRW